MTPQNTSTQELPRSLSYKLRTKGSGTWHALNSSWMTAAEPWVVIHDLFHHLPSDTGSFLDEWRTLGAEYYINHESLRDTSLKARSLSRNAESVVGLAIDCGAVPEDFVLPAIASLPLDARVREAFVDAVRHAREELRIHDFESDPAWSSALAAFSNEELFVAHLASGYHLAKARFPDQLRAHASFAAGLAKLEELTSSAKVGDVIVVTLKGYDITITLSNTLLDNLS